VESNLDIKTPKLNVQNVSSAVFGKDGGSNGSMKNIHGTISKLAGHVRKAVIRIGALEKRVDSQEEKTTKIINILKTQKSNVGGKIPATGGQNNLEKELAEVNKTLVEVQKELQRYFSFQAKTDKEEKATLSREQSKKKLKAEESELRRSSKKLGSSIKESANSIAKPVAGIFDSIMDFVGTLLLGIGSNAIFEWLKNEENRKKIGEWFSWIKEHWVWIVGVLGAIALLPLIGVLGSVLTIVGSVVGVLLSAITPLLGLLASPALLTFLALMAAEAIAPARTAEYDQTSGEKAVYMDPSRQIEQPNKTGFLGIGNENTKEHKTFRAKQLIYTIESIEGDREYSNWEENAQKKYNDAVAFLQLDKTKVLSRLTPRVEYSKRLQKFLTDNPNKGMGDFGEQEPTRYIPLDMNTLKKRKTGGPVQAGTPYLVGDQLGMKTAEIFVPNVDGNIISNEKTNKIVEIIKSKKRGRGGVNITTLPMQMNELPPPEVKIPGGMNATDVPDISSVNMADPYRNMVSRNILGITV
jgi:hypothetical protein